MSKIAIMYSFKATKSKQVADKLIKEFGKDAEAIDADKLTEEVFESYDKIICGVPTWFDGELPNYWDEFVPALEEMNLKGKQIAYYGLGDQKGYPENFVDAIGVLSQIMENQGAKTVGLTSNKEYTYESSKAERGDKFVGLALDFENEAKKVSAKVKEWAEQLKAEFK